MDLDPAFLTAVETRDPGGCMGLAVVGDISRTWFADRDLLIDLLEFLWPEDEEMFVSIHGDFGFGLMVEEAVLGMGMKLRSLSQDDGVTREERFGYRAVHAYDLYAETIGLVVMTRRKQPKDVWEVDPHVLDSAVQHGLPVFALNEEGIMWPWP
jgi:hypothetical protein